MIADQAYAIELKHEAQLLFTAQVDGRGILVCETPQKLIIVHHNIQVAAAGQNILQSEFESQRNYRTSDREHRFDARARALQELSAHIIANNSGITGGTPANK